MLAQPPGTHLAQLNVGHIRFPTDDPRLAEFMGALDSVNALAERSPGFVWRLKSDSGNATDILVSADPTFLVNMSVWETAEQLEHFVWTVLEDGPFNLWIGPLLGWWRKQSTFEVKPATKGRRVSPGQFLQRLVRSAAGEPMDRHTAAV